MKEDERETAARELVHALAERLPTAEPRVPSLLAEAHRRRRRRGGQALLAAAAVLVVAVTGTVVSGQVGADRSISPAGTPTGQVGPLPSEGPSGPPAELPAELPVDDRGCPVFGTAEELAGEPVDLPRDPVDVRLCRTPLGSNPDVEPPDAVLTAQAAQLAEQVRGVLRQGRVAPTAPCTEQAVPAYLLRFGYADGSSRLVHLLAGSSAQCDAVMLGQGQEGETRFAAYAATDVLRALSHPVAEASGEVFPADPRVLRRCGPQTRPGGRAGAPAPGEVWVFFGCDHDPEFRAWATTRATDHSAGTEERLTTAVAEWLRGPAPDDPPQLSGGAPEPDVLNEVRIEGERAIIDLDWVTGRFVFASAATMAYGSQLRAMAFQFPEVTELEIRHDGSCEAYQTLGESYGCTIRLRDGGFREE